MLLLSFANGGNRSELGGCDVFSTDKCRRNDTTEGRAMSTRVDSAVCHTFIHNGPTLKGKPACTFLFLVQMPRQASDLKQSFLVGPYEDDPTRHQQQETSYGLVIEQLQLLSLTSLSVISQVGNLSRN